MAWGAAFKFKDGDSFGSVWLKSKERERERDLVWGRYCITTSGRSS